MNPKLIKIGLYVIGAVIFVSIFAPFTIVRSGMRGLVFNWGAIQDQTLDQGIHFRVPLMQSVQQVTIQPIQLDYQIVVGQDGAITKDNQTVGADMTVFYQYDPTKLVQLYRDIGLDNMTSIVRSSVKESFKEAIGDETIFDVAANQEQIRNKVTTAIKDKLKGYPIMVTEFRISNYDWSDEFNKQIEQTMVRAQNVKQAEQDLLVTQQQAQKIVKEAEAAKQAAVTKAEGDRDAAKLEAEAKALEGQGIKQYNDSIAANIDIELKLRQLEIEKARVEKWNGAYVPTNNYLPIPFTTGASQGK